MDISAMPFRELVGLRESVSARMKVLILELQRTCPHPPEAMLPVTTMRVAHYCSMCGATDSDLADGQCGVCKEVFRHRELYSCVRRGNPRVFIPWVCEACHQDCPGPHCSIWSRDARALREAEQRILKGMETPRPSPA